MINKLLFSILLIVLLPIICASQGKSIDSLQVVLKTAPSDTNRVKTLNTLATKFYDKNEYDLSLLYANEAKHLAKEINYRRGIAAAYKLTGYILIKKGEYINAIDSIDKAIEIQKSLEDKIEEGSSYNVKGNIYLMKGDYKEALHFLLQGLKILEETKNRKAIGMAYNGIGIAYYSQHNYTNATEAFKKSLSFKDSIKDKQGIALGYNNLGIIYLEQKNYEDALDSYNKSLKLRRQIDDKQGIADCYDNIGIVYYEQGKYDLAIKYHFKALKIAQESKHLPVISHSYINIGKVYLKLGKLNDADEYLNYALILSKKLADKNTLKDTYEQLAELHYLKKEYKRAYDYYKIFTSYTDTLYDIQSNKQMAEMSQKYEAEKKDRELLKLTIDNKVKQIELKEKEVQRRNLLITVGASILVMIILVILGIILKRSNTKIKSINTILINQSNEIEQKSKEINNQAVQIARYQSQMNPHFIFNAINGLQSMVLEEDKYSAIEQIHSLSKLLRLTLNNSESEYISLLEEEAYLNKYVEFELLRFKKKFKFTFSVNKDIDKNWRLPTMIIQPMVENAIKHAGLNDKSDGRITVTVSKAEKYNENIFEISVEDNGNGIKLNGGGLESKGLKITKQRLLLEHKKNDILIEESLSIKNRIQEGTDTVGGTVVKIICPWYQT